MEYVSLPLFSKTVRKAILHVPYASVREVGVGVTM